MSEPELLAQRRADIEKLLEGAKPYFLAEVKAKWISARGLAMALYGGVKPYDEAEVNEPPHMALPEAAAFHRHCESCPACSNHIKAMCNEGRRLLNEWAISYTDSRVN